MFCQIFSCYRAYKALLDGVTPEAKNKLEYECAWLEQVRALALPTFHSISTPTVPFLYAKFIVLLRTH